MAEVAAPSSLAIHTHHCLCSNLVFATTFDISALPTRAQSSLDRATVLPCPPPPRNVQISADGAQEQDEPDPNATDDATTRDYTLLCSVAAPGKSAAVVVRREDGFEKRWLVRCARCRVALGYQLDWSQFPAADDEGRREDVLYLLPGSTVSTEDMKARRRPREEELTFTNNASG